MPAHPLHRLLIFIAVLALALDGVFAETMEQRMVRDGYISCTSTGDCAGTPFGAQYDAAMLNYAPQPAPGLNGSIPPAIGDMVKLTKLYECGSTGGGEHDAAGHSCIH